METTSIGKPLQRISWNEKVAKGKQWFKNNIDYYTSQCFFGVTSTSATSSKKNINTLYQIYNNKFPTNLFSHVTNPLGTSNPNYKRFPAKIRPVNILRTNIDQLWSEFSRRPFSYTVQNMGEDGYISYIDNLNQELQGNITNMFIQRAWAAAQQQGIDAEAFQQNLDTEALMPEDVKMRFKATYKDNLAISGQRWLDRTIQEFCIMQIFRKSFKDFLIAGEAYTYKGFNNGEFEMKRVSPLNIDYDKSPDTDFVEDGEWASAVYYMTVADVVDRFYDSDISEEDWKAINNYGWTSSQGMYDWFTSSYEQDTWNKIPVYHVVWKAQSKIGILTRQDPETGEVEQDEVAEGYKAQEGEHIEWKWVNEVYEGWRIGGTMNGGGTAPAIYCEMQPIQVQRNAMNNYSYCKLPYNGRKFSDTHAKNISLMEMGIPYQLLYIIVTFKLEEYIAKSKGKIVMLDKNAIPKTDGWDEDKFFYYSQALGWGLLNRNQVGVDKSFNQYQVLDMSLFENIQQMINLQNWCKDSWDSLLGFTPQRKGQMAATETATNAQSAIFQSSLITEMVFILFEEFMEKELQGILDYSKFAVTKGVKALYNTEDWDLVAFQITPEEYCMASLGLFMTNSSKELDRLRKMEALTQPMLQNNTKPSTVAEIFTSRSMAELKAKLKQVEDIQAKMDQAAAQSEQEAAAAADQRAKEFTGYEMMLKTQFMNAEYDRKEDLELLKGDVTLTSIGMTDANNNGIPDINEIAQRDLERSQNMSENSLKMADLAQRTKNDREQRALDQQKLKLDKYKIDMDYKREQLKAKTAIKNRVVGEKNKKK